MFDLFLYGDVSLIHNSLSLLFNTFKYEGGVKSSRTCLPENQDKPLLGRELDRSCSHRHTMSMIKLFWSQPIDSWASTAAYGQGEKFSA